MAHGEENGPQFGHAMRSHFQFDPSYIPLNHGSFGTYPNVVRDRLRYFQDLSESRPDAFFRFNLAKLLDPARSAIADFLDVDAGECVFLPNATTGVNTVLRSLIFEKGDVIVYFSTIYGACEKTVDYLKETTPVESVNIPLRYPLRDDEVVTKLQDKIKALKGEGRRARVAIFDTVSSLPGVRVPWERLVEACREEGTLSLVDAAHGIGHIQLNLGQVQPDFFVSNCHKWLYVPRGCALFYVPVKNQHLIRSSIPTSHGYEPYPVDGQEQVFNPLPVNGTSPFVNMFQFVGTMDIGPYLCMEEALRFRQELCGGEEPIMAYCEHISNEGGQKVATMLGTEVMENEEKTLRKCPMTNVRLPLRLGQASGQIQPADGFKACAWMAKTLITEHNVFAPPFFHDGYLWIRFSGQIYVEIEDFVAAAEVYKELSAQQAKQRSMWCADQAGGMSYTMYSMTTINFNLFGIRMSKKHQDKLKQSILPDIPASSALSPMTTAPLIKSTSAGWKTSSDSSSHPDHSSTPAFTPTGTPPHNPYTASLASNTMEDSRPEASTTKEDAQTKTTEDISAQNESKVKDAGDTKIKRAACRKHPKGHKPTKKSKKKEETSSESESSSASSTTDSDAESSASESEEPETSSSSSEEDAEAARKRRLKAKKAKKMKERKKAKSRKHKESTDDDSDSESSEDSESDMDAKRKRARLRKKRKSKKSKKEVEESESEAEDDEDDLARTKAQLSSLGLRSRRAGKQGRSGRGGRGHIDDRTLKKALKAKKDKGSKKKKRGSKVDFVRVDQLWDSSIHNYKLTETAEDADADEYDQYVFTVRRKFDWENKYTDTVVDIKSKPLKEALTHVMGAVKGVSFAEETPIVDPNMLFLYLEELRIHMKELKSQSKSEKKKKLKKAAALKFGHVRVLIKYLDKDYAETKKTLYPLLESNTITFDLLWALFKSNEIAYCPTYSNPDEPRAFKIEYATKENSFMKGTWYNIEGRYLEYDGKQFGMGTMEVEVEQFKGPRKISSLACYPLKYHKDAESLKLKLIERGKKFVGLEGMNYRFHKGMGFYKKKRQVIKVNINGRVMVDPAIHRRINPNYPISTVKPKDPDILDEDEDSDEGSCGCCGSSEEEDARPRDQLEDADKARTKMKLVMDEHERPHIVEVELDEQGNEIQKEDIDHLPNNQDGTSKKEFTEEELLIASPVVLGFAFSEKLWLEFTVSGINEIEWNEGAFSSLVLPDSQKSIVKALVESHTFSASRNIDDVIQGKGRGLVAVLHGPPGTGKTLTAEGIAELLKCPLYMVSAGELGTNPRELEAELNKILDIAHSWGAVLLLDEADVFLEKRTIQDIHRNALVSIFLRLLEYFQGILFLTTNRVETFDDAFQSRIHVALRYGELTTKAKRSVWKMFLNKVAEKDGVETAVFKEADFDKLARHNMNGRQIKNAVRTAQALAVNEKKALDMGHIAKVLEVAETFEKDLKGGTGYEDAMRSYT
ncbi:MAG: hypothetical protein Q9168_002724 [Polycauliona sp. 1 TL-2023]